MLNVTQSNNIMKYLVVFIHFVHRTVFSASDRFGGHREKRGVLLLLKLVVILTWSHFQNDNECSDPLKIVSKQPGMNSTVNQYKQSRQIFLTTNLWTVKRTTTTTTSSHLSSFIRLDSFCYNLSSIYSKGVFARGSLVSEPMCILVLCLKIKCSTQHTS